MKMLSASFTATSAAIALAVSGFVPAPSSVSLFSSAAHAGPPSQGSSKGSRGKQRGGKKGKAPAAKNAKNAQKKGTRKASGKSSKPKTTAVTSKAPAADPPRRDSASGKRMAANYSTMAGVANTAVNMGLSAGSAGSVGRGPPPPLPPRAKGKAAAEPAKQAAKTQKRGKRRAEGKSSKSKTDRVGAKQAGPSRQGTKRGKRKVANISAKRGLAVPRHLAAAAPTTSPPVPTRVAQSPRRTQKATASPEMQASSRARKQTRVTSETSSVMTRAIRPLGGGDPITPARPPQAKQGKKSRFYFNPFRGWFGGGKKKQNPS